MQSDDLRGRDKQQDDLTDDSRAVKDTPEGLKRAPKGPVGKTEGRRDQAQAERIPSPGEPAGGE
jgi:hypothetical protein